MWQSKSLVIPKTEKYIASPPPPPHTHTHTQSGKQAGGIQETGVKRWWIKAMLNGEGWVGGCGYHSCTPSRDQVDTNMQQLSSNPVKSPIPTITHCTACQETPIITHCTACQETPIITHCTACQETPIVTHCTTN